MKNTMMITLCFAKYEIGRLKIWFCPQLMYFLYASNVFRFGNSRKLLVFGYSLITTAKII